MNMSKELKKEWLAKLLLRYARRNHEGKSRMLDELCEDYDYERKYAIKLLGGGSPPRCGRVHPGPERFTQNPRCLLFMSQWGVTGDRPRRAT